MKDIGLEKFAVVDVRGDMERLTALGDLKFSCCFDGLTQAKISESGLAGCDSGEVVDS